MTFKQLKSKIKLYKNLIYISLIMMFAGSLLFRVRRFDVSTQTPFNLLLTAIAFVIITVSIVTVFYSLHYISFHTKCVKCKKQIDIKTFIKMENFKCPHCGNEKFDNDVAEIWFK